MCQQLESVEEVPTSIRDHTILGALIKIASSDLIFAHSILIQELQYAKKWHFSAQSFVTKLFMRQYINQLSPFFSDKFFLGIYSNYGLLPLLYIPVL